jgi:hypothetical protein
LWSSAVPPRVPRRRNGLAVPAGKATGPVDKMEDGGRPLACRRLRDSKTPLPSGPLLRRTGQLFASFDFSFPPSPGQTWRIQVETPNRGNSHPWTKNHAATTITNINKSFIFVLLNLPHCRGRFIPRPSGYPGMFRSMSAASFSLVVRPMRVSRTFPSWMKSRVGMLWIP